MRTVELELSDGRVIEMDLEDAKPAEATTPKESPASGISYKEALSSGAQAALTPHPEQIGMGDMAQRFGQATLGSIYSQGRGAIQKAVPSGVAQNMGQGMTSVLPMGVDRLLKPSTKEAVGREGVGVGVDVGVGLATGLLNKVGSSIGRVGQKPIQMFQGVMGSGKALKGVEEEIQAISSMPSERAITKGTNLGLKILSKAEKSMVEEVKQAGKSDITTLTDTFKSRKQFLDQALNKESLVSSSEAKSKLRNVFSNMTTIYRKGLDKAESALAKRGETLTKNDMFEVIGKTVDELEMRGTNVQSPVRSILDDQIIPKITELSDDTITLSQAKDIKNLVFDSLSSGSKHGTQYFDELDSAKNIFLKNYGDLLGTRSPELAKLNAEFAPMAQARRWATRSFRPFNQQEIQRGADILRRIASSDKPNQTDLNYLKVLETGSGQFKGAGSLRGKTVKLGSERQVITKSFDTAKRNLVDSIDYRINQIESSFKPDISSVKRAGFEQVQDFQERQGRLQQLTFKREQLKTLKNIRNWAIGATLAWTVGRPVTSALLQAKGVHSIDLLNRNT